MLTDMVCIITPGYTCVSQSVQFFRITFPERTHQNLLKGVGMVGINDMEISSSKNEQGSLRPLLNLNDTDERKRYQMTFFFAAFGL